jgi:uncharacterized protein (DUF736 family)
MLFPAGALWKHAKYDDMFYGNLIINGQRIRIAVGPNQQKQSGRHPDYRIFWQIDDERYDGGPTDNVWQEDVDVQLDEKPQF